MMTQKEIEDEGKAQYDKWRAEKDKTNYLKAQNKVAGVFDYFKSTEELDLQYEKDFKIWGDKLDYRNKNDREPYRGDYGDRYNPTATYGIRYEEAPKKPKGYDKRKAKKQKKIAEEQKKRAEEAQIKWHEDNPHYGLEHEQPVVPEDNSPFKGNPYL